MKSVTLNAYAKINITLDVLGKRENGYHDVRMIMQMLQLCDKVTVTLKDKGITLKNNVNFLPGDNRNLAYRACELFFRQTGINMGADVYIEKNIPVSAGLAGGSSDAAATLEALNILTGADLPMGKLMEMGITLGADVPYCILKKTALAEGTGEKLTVLPQLKESVVCLAKPDYNINTASVYKELDSKKNTMHPDTEGAISAIEKKDLRLLGKRMYNVLEEVTGEKLSIIGKIKSIMYDNGSVGAMMSGSGPSVFGFFEEEQSAQNACEEIKKLCSFCKVTKTLSI